MRKLIIYDFLFIPPDHGDPLSSLMYRFHQELAKLRMHHFWCTILHPNGWLFLPC